MGASVVLRSLRTRLALLVLAVVLLALAVVYVGVVPQLESSLRDEKLRTLDEQVRSYGPALQAAIDDSASAPKVDALVRDTADAAGVRVTVLGVNAGDLGLTTYLKSDSTREVQTQLRFDIAVDAARTGRVQTATEAGGRIGQAALPLSFRDADSGEDVVGAVMVFSEPLDDVEGDVAVIRNRIILVGFVALALAAAAAWLAARPTARRVKELEQVAGRVAHGDFEARFPVRDDDELGQLARALDDMRRQLAELDDARKRFIATASHELRTPLFSLGGFVELLEDEDVPEEDRREFIAQLRLQVGRLSRLATDLLDLSRLEAGSVELRREPTDLRALAQAVTAEFRPALDTHDSTVEVRLPPHPVRVLCDPDRVAQVMRILLDNAITHTPPGTDLVVSASRRDALVRLGVGDFGPGIPRAMLPRIFEPFVTSDDAQGSGLGLAIAHELAERMDGRLVVESQPGRTTFTLELPA
ncbi:MAG TPA: HAMP domain-containing sensor histidine kinase [Baekduia sp.]|nr:HAMP domain-containing sensor histidine kinase [Baekduia sp.]